MQTMTSTSLCNYRGGESVDFIGQMLADALTDIIDVYEPNVDFGASEPNTYAIYNYTEQGAEYAEGVDNSTLYFITLNIFSSSVDHSLYAKIKRTLRLRGLGYISGGRVDTDNTYPYIRQYHLDFSLIVGGDL